MRIVFLTGACAALILTGSYARAEDGARYAFQKSADGIARLDTQTGQVSMCEQKSGQLVCKPAVEERQASQGRVDQLQQKVDRLEKRLDTLEARVVSPKDLLPSDEQVDKTLNIMERFFRQFMNIAKDFDKTFRQDDPPAAAPEKT